MASSGILKLPNELLIYIFEVTSLRTEDGSEDGRRDTIPNLRLTCQLFNVLSSPLLYRELEVDISRPETVSLLQRVATHPYMAKGVKLLDIRVHFYHPWVAATYENFVEALKAQWPQYGPNFRSRCRPNLGLDTLIGMFFTKLAREELGYHYPAERENDQNAVITTQSGDTLLRDSDVSRLGTSEVLSKAYDAYKRAFQAQDRILSNGNLLSALSHSLSKFVNLSFTCIYDRKMGTWKEPYVDHIVVNSEDDAGQEKALVRALSRPMNWETTRWIMENIEPDEGICEGVPVNLLIDIPVAIAKAKSISIKEFNIEVSPPPDYTLLPTDPDSLALLSTAIESMPLLSLNFAPCCTNGPPPNTYVDDPPVTPESLSTAEIQALNRYIGALLDSESICRVDVNLKNLGFNALTPFHFVTTSLGDNWLLRPGLSLVILRKMPVTSDYIKRFAAAKGKDTEIYLSEINLLGDTWTNMLETLREMPRKPNIYITDPCGGGLDELDRKRYSQIFGGHPDESLSWKFIHKMIDVNPLL